MNNLIPYKNPDPWRDAYAYAGTDVAKLKTLCLLLLEEREWLQGEAKKAGVVIASRARPPRWFG